MIIYSHEELEKIAMWKESFWTKSHTEKEMLYTELQESVGIPVHFLNQNGSVLSSYFSFFIADPVADRLNKVKTVDGSTLEEVSGVRISVCMHAPVYIIGDSICYFRGIRLINMGDFGISNISDFKLANQYVVSKVLKFFEARNICRLSYKDLCLEYDGDIYGSYPFDREYLMMFDVFFHDVM